MKIGINASSFRRPDTGIGQVTANFVNFLANSAELIIPKLGLKIKDIDFFLYLEEDIDLKLPKNFHKRIFLPKFQKRDDLFRKILWEKFLLPAKVKQDKCELFISLYQSASIIKSAKHKLIVHDMIWKVFPEYLDNWRKKLYAALCFRAITKADQVLTISSWSKRDIHKYLNIPLEKISVAYPSVNELFFEETDRDSDNAVLEGYNIFGRFIFYIGGLDFRKNIPTLLSAFKILQEKNNLKDLKLVIGGEDKSKYSNLFTNINREMNNLDLQNGVQPIGFVKQKDLPALYRQCEFFVFPSLYEGFGLSPLEALASGSPVAMSKSSSLPEVGGDSVLYFNPYDADEIAKVMNKILTNTKLMHRLSEKGRERAKKFEWKIFAQKIFE
jgi:glycosyltransferase involved in cell wall biosynthesis